jgi:sucrose-6-phosphate hydrolase SacC (GH32 family)
VQFHLAHPTPAGRGWPWDANCAVYWRGRYHLFYILPGADELDDAFAHVSSDDLIRWRWHPPLLPPDGHGMWSGGAVVTKDDRVAIVYHGAGGNDPIDIEQEVHGRNHVRFAEDDLLENWSAPIAIHPKPAGNREESEFTSWDPEVFLDGDHYYAVFGARAGRSASLHRSPDLMDWTYLGPLMTRDLPDTVEDWDISTPNFFPIGDKHMLLCISHNKGARYYIGEWKDEQFAPEVHGRMNWHGFPPADLVSVESLLTPDGRRVMWAWLGCVDASRGQGGVQSLPRELSLGDNGDLRIRPLRELQELRHGEMTRTGVKVSAGVPFAVEKPANNLYEMRLRVEMRASSSVGVRVHCNDMGAGGVEIEVDRDRAVFRVGESEAPFVPGSDVLDLTVFVDNHVIEAFVDGVQAIATSSPVRPRSTGVIASAKGDDVNVDITVWQISSIYSQQ